jgi:hypothetical protein
MLPLLGTTIAGASVVPPGTLRLTWSNGHVLEIMDSSERYESYVVTCGDKLIVV